MLSCRCVVVLSALAVASPALAQTTTPKTPKKAAAPVKTGEKTRRPRRQRRPPRPTDVQIKTKYVNGAQTTENRTFLKGVRQRFEFPGVTMISQCDLNRSVQLNDATKHYMVVTTPQTATPLPAAAPAAPAPSSKPQGGVIAETITLTDTGERKQVFGLEARHIKTSTVRRPGANACDPKTTTVDVDGWYADLPRAGVLSHRRRGVPAADGEPAPIALKRSRSAVPNWVRAEHRDDDDDRGRQGKGRDDGGDGGDRLARDVARRVAVPHPTGIHRGDEAIPTCCRSSRAAAASPTRCSDVADGTSTIGPKKPGADPRRRRRSDGQEPAETSPCRCSAAA